MPGILTASAAFLFEGAMGSAAGIGVEDRFCACWMCSDFVRRSIIVWILWVWVSRARSWTLAASVLGVLDEGRDEAWWDGCLLTWSRASEEQAGLEFAGELCVSNREVDIS